MAWDTFSGGKVEAGHEETRTFKEVTAVGDLLRRLQPVVGAVNRAQVAIIYDFQNEWALDLAQLPRSEDKNYQQRCQLHYRPFWQRGITVDIINADFDNFEQYKLLLVPMLYMLPEGVAERLGRFVAAGGTIVTTYLSGLVNQTDLAFMGGAPGPLQELLGIWVEETDVLYAHHEQSIRFTRGPLGGSSYPVAHYADVLHLRGAEVLAVYEQEYCADLPAVTVNQFGNGRAYYLAARCDARFLNDFYDWLASDLSLSVALDASPLPLGVTAQVRRTESESYVFLLNFAPVEQTVHLKGETAVDFLSGQLLGCEIALAPYGFHILRLARNLT
jgi:beta-galactosidase